MSSGQAARTAFPGWRSPSCERFAPRTVNKDGDDGTIMTDDKRTAEDVDFGNASIQYNNL
jgi:hypothetical protein